jgi:HK97 family phage major capsid protein
MSDDIQKAVEAVKTINTAFQEFKAANDARLAEIEKKGAVDPLITAKLDKIEADLEAAQKIADDAVLAVKRQSRVVTDDRGNPIDLEAKAAAWADLASDVLKRPRQSGYTADALAEYGAKSLKYFKRGMEDLSDAEKKALSVGGDPTGGYLVRPETDGRIVQKIEDTSPIRAYAQTISIGSDAYEFVFDLDRAGATWVSETETRGQTSTPRLGIGRIPVHELQAMPAATQKLLDDASLDVEGWLAGKVAQEFSLTENAAYVNGNGVGKPRGFLSYGDGTTLPGTIEQIPTGVSGGFAAAPAGGDVLITAYESLKAGYRGNANWFMNRTTRAAVRKLKDSDGAYLWQPGIQAGAPATLLGVSVAVPFEDMPDIAASSLSIAVGDMRQAYLIVDRMGVRILRDPYSAKPYVLFYTTKRTGGDVTNFEALKLIRFNS